MNDDAPGIAYVLDPREIGDRLALNIRERIDEPIYINYLDDKESTA
jgi:hypothetical protein